MKIKNDLCMTCYGTGVMHGGACPRCNGTGVASDPVARRYAFAFIVVVWLLVAAVVVRCTT